MRKTGLLAKAIFNITLWLIPAFAVGAMSIDLYAKGISSPFASLLSAFLGLYVGFLVVWKIFCLMDLVGTWLMDTRRAIIKSARLSHAGSNWKSAEAVAS